MPIYKSSFRRYIGNVPFRSKTRTLADGKVEASTQFNQKKLSAIGISVRDATVKLREKFNLEALKTEIPTR